MRRTRLFQGVCHMHIAGRIVLGCLVVAAALLPLKGCVAGGDPPARNDANDNAPVNDNEGGTGNNNDNQSPDNDNTAPLVRSSLAVSNPTPGLNELVTLTCRVVDLDPPAVDRFEFLGRVDRLTIDEARGTASFVVSESDLNTSMQFSCRAILENGDSGLVSPVVIITIGE